MELNSQPSRSAGDPRQILEDQLREIYGRAAYSHKTHEKMADSYVTRYRLVKITEVGLSALGTGSLLLAIIGDSKPYTIAGAFISTALLALALYFREGSLGEQSQKHAVTATRLWTIRERLLSLLIDVRSGIEVEGIRLRRDDINAQLEEIYKAAPRTTAKAYEAAQRALKDNEELYFSAAELDQLLPEILRKVGSSE